MLALQCAISRARQERAGIVRGQGTLGTYPQRNLLPPLGVAHVYTLDHGWVLGRVLSDALYGVRR
jgi:hypothetical protein